VPPVKGMCVPHRRFRRCGEDKNPIRPGRETHSTTLQPEKTQTEPFRFQRDLWIRAVKMAQRKDMISAQKTFHPLTFISESRCLFGRLCRHPYCSPTGCTYLRGKRGGIPGGRTCSETEQQPTEVVLKK
jgi:hypothetical protein